MFCEKEETKWRKYSYSNLIALISDTFQLHRVGGEECLSLLFTAENRQDLFFFLLELYTALFFHQQKIISEQRRHILSLHSSRTYDTYTASIMTTIVNNEE
jgi:hypothetical protein